MHPVLVDFGTFHIGSRAVPLVIGGYGVMFALALLCGWILTRRLGREIDPAVPWTDVFFYTILAGFLGAKVANVLVSLPDLLAGRRSLTGTLLGGGVWFGGVIAGSVVWYALAKRHGIRPGRLANLVFVIAPLCHAIGRIGCFLGGCCYGTSCDLPWAVTYTDPAAKRLNGTPLGVPLHPTVLYEAGLELVNFLICFWLWRRKAADWTIAALWLGLYGIERFLLELLRGDPRGFLGPLSTSQWLSLVAVGCSAALWLRARAK